MMKITRPSLRILAAALVSVLFVALFPTGSADAARPVCASSKTVKFKHDIPTSLDATIHVWIRACIDSGVVRLELRQKGMGAGGGGDRLVEPVLDGEIQLRVYSTSTNGRFLHSIVKEESVWLGDVAQRFATGAANKRGYMVYARSARLSDVSLAGLTSGQYQLSVELLLDYVTDETPPKSTGPRYVKFKI